MAKPTYIALDTETGGIGPEVSLLTAFFVVLDENLEPIEPLYLRIKPDNGIYHVTAEALGINKIDLVMHEKIATTASVAGGQLREFLVRHSSNGATKLVPIGHNVAFDLEKVYSCVLNKKESQKYVSYRTLDTGVVAQALKAVGKMPESVSGSLGSLVKHFGVEELTAHDAAGDTLMTVAVLKKELEQLR